jgi:cell division protein FtsB
MTRQVRMMHNNRLASTRQNDAGESRVEVCRRNWLQIFGVALIAVFGALHLYSMNRIAVQGYAIRSAEKKLAALKQENNQLRIQEAELKSLQRIEEAGRRLNMFEPQEVSYIEENSPVALR